MKKEFEIIPKKGTRKSIIVYSTAGFFLIVEEISKGRESKWNVYLSQVRPRHYLGAKSIDDIANAGPAIATIKGGYKKARRWGSKGGFASAKDRPFHINMNYNEQIKKGWGEPQSSVSSLEIAISEIAKAIQD
jgi:hypothetical protein